MYEIHIKIHLEQSTEVSYSRQFCFLAVQGRALDTTAALWLWTKPCSCRVVEEKCQGGRKREWEPLACKYSMH